MSIAKHDDGTLVVTDPDVLNVFRPLALRSALKLECKGLRAWPGRLSPYRIIKQEYGLRGNKQSVLEQFDALLREGGLLRGNS